MNPDPCFHFKADPDSAFQSVADPDADLAPHQGYANLRPLDSGPPDLHF